MILMNQYFLFIIVLIDAQFLLLTELRIEWQCQSHKTTLISCMASRWKNTFTIAVSYAIRTTQSLINLISYILHIYVARRELSKLSNWLSPSHEGIVLQCDDNKIRLRWLFLLDETRKSGPFLSNLMSIHTFWVSPRRVPKVQQSARLFLRRMKIFGSVGPEIQRLVRLGVLLPKDIFWADWKNNHEK